MFSFKIIFLLLFFHNKNYHMYLWNATRNELIRENKTELDFITIVKSIFDKRKEYN